MGATDVMIGGGSLRWSRPERAGVASGDKQARRCGSYTYGGPHFRIPTVSAVSTGDSPA